MIQIREPKKPKTEPWDEDAGDNARCLPEDMGAQG